MYKNLQGDPGTFRIATSTPSRVSLFLSGGGGASRHSRVYPVDFPTIQSLVRHEHRALPGDFVGHAPPNALLYRKPTRIYPESAEFCS